MLRALHGLELDPFATCKTGDTPAHLAAQTGNIAALQWLGTMPNSAAGLRKQNHMGQTPVHRAAIQGELLAVKMICSLSPGVEHAADHASCTALDMAREMHQYKVVWYLTQRSMRRIQSKKRANTGRQIAREKKQAVMLIGMTFLAHARAVSGAAMALLLMICSSLICMPGFCLCAITEHQAKEEGSSQVAQGKEKGRRGSGNEHAIIYEDSEA